MSYEKPDDIPAPTPAELQFNTSSKFSDRVPPGYPTWAIRNDYPPAKPKSDVTVPETPPIGVLDAPWLNVDPFTTPKDYLHIIKHYCFDGMIDVDFVPQKNTVRNWYHAPWMHYGDAGREPIHGLTSERYTPPRELSATQQRTTQTWAVGFFNTIAASALGGMWKDPNQPDWSDDISFPMGTMIYKLLFTNATNDELPILHGAPTWEGLIAVQPEDPTQSPDPKTRDLVNPQPVRLLQVDIMTRDDRAKTGWIFGTFMYTNTFGKTGWEGLIPVGLQWGNDPELTQAEHDAGKTVQQSWINVDADYVRVSLHGGRPSFGWNGRLNGPADNFISACASCHSTAQWPMSMNMVPKPAPTKTADGKFVPVDDAVYMQWFQDIPCGTAISKGSVSADNSLQLMVGYDNFTKWEEKQPREKLPGGGEHLPRPPIRHLPDHPRQGPDMGF